MKVKDIKYLTLKLTNQCNLNCAMCGQVFDPKRSSKDELELKIIERILDEASYIEQVYLFGGETLLYSKLPELLKLLHDRQIKSRITTNGTLLKRCAKDIVEYGVTNVEVSWDSCKKDVLKRIRGYDIYDLLVEGIECLNQEKKKRNSEYPHININCVILPYNYKEIVEFVEHIRRQLIGVDSIYFQYPMVTTQTQGEAQNKILQEVFNKECFSWKWFYNSNQLLKDEEIRQVYDGLETLKNDPIVLFKKVKNYEELKKIVSAEVVNKNIVCDCPFAALTILPNGDATFCTDFPDIILGNVYEKKLNDIWRGEMGMKFREYLNTKGNFPICASCYHTDEKLIEKMYCKGE